MCSKNGTTIVYIFFYLMTLLFHNGDQCVSFNSCSFDCVKSIFLCSNISTSTFCLSTLASNAFIISITVARNINIRHTSCTVTPIRPMIILSHWSGQSEKYKLRLPALKGIDNDVRQTVRMKNSIDCPENVSTIENKRNE